LVALWWAPAEAADPGPQETVQSDISTREISIQSNFAGIEIVIFGSIDFSHAPSPDEGSYDVITVIRSPEESIVVRRKERVAGIWVNRSGQTFKRAPGFYAVLGTRPFKAITTEDTLKQLGIGFSNLDFGKSDRDDPALAAYRSAVIRLKQQQNLFQEHDDGVAFIGRSLFRSSIELPANVTVGPFDTRVYLFREEKLLSQYSIRLNLEREGLERHLHGFAFAYPTLYGLMTVVIAVAAGLLASAAFRKTAS
jgi:uncharacterized protein (TIGR02186 family)